MDFTRLLVSAVIMTISCDVMAQNKLPLQNLDDFKTQAGNWQIVGDVVVNRNMDVHDQPAPEVESKKKKKKKSKTPATKPLKAIEFTEGTGILLNINDEVRKDHIITKWEHGDIELELDVMMPRGSNSGIYLQGRYELQLIDSWGVKNPKFSDIGGIYRNWETDPSKKLAGIPPSVNAAKAPGLWQKLKINFRAPRFDENGNKIRNAKFVYVDLNGVRIHSNVEVALPTGGPISKEEVAMGPIMIQGDHGPVAIRNFSYKLFEELMVEVRDLTYKSYSGAFNGLEKFIDSPPQKEGSIPLIDVNLAEAEDQYGLIFSGMLSIPKDDDYTLYLTYTGGARLTINDELTVEDITKNDGDATLEKVKFLKAGDYPFKIYNYKNAGWRPAKLGLQIQSTTSHKKAFHTYDSYPDTPVNISPIFVDAIKEPRLLRGFVNFNGNGPKLSHTIGVGTTKGLNYIYDLNSANLVGAWRGDFLDATPMWHRRGNATFVPRGAVQWTSINQPLAELDNLDSPFPESADFTEFKPLGYDLDASSRLPTFKHKYKGVEVTNFVSSDPTDTYVIQEISFSKTGMANWYYKIASGNSINKTPDGSYAVNDRQYYINILTNQTPKIRELGGQKELLVPVDGSKIKYEMIW